MKTEELHFLAGVLAGAYSTRYLVSAQGSSRTCDVAVANLEDAVSCLPNLSPEEVQQIRKEANEYYAAFIAGSAVAQGMSPRGVS